MLDMAAGTSFESQLQTNSIGVDILPRSLSATWNASQCSHIFQTSNSKKLVKSSAICEA